MQRSENKPKFSCNVWVQTSKCWREGGIPRVPLRAEYKGDHEWVPTCLSPLPMP